MSDLRLRIQERKQVGSRCQKRGGRTRGVRSVEKRAAIHGVLIDPGLAAPAMRQQRLPALRVVSPPALAQAVTSEAVASGCREPLPTRGWRQHR